MELKKENPLYKSACIEVQLNSSMGHPQLSVLKERDFLRNGLKDLKYIKFKPEDINTIMKQTISDFQQSQTSSEEFSKRLKFDKQACSTEDYKSLYDGKPNQIIISLLNPQKKEMLLGVKLQYTEPQELISRFEQTVKSMPDWIVLPQPGPEKLNLQYRQSIENKVIPIPSRGISNFENEVNNYNKLIVGIPKFQNIVNDYNMSNDQYVKYMCLMKNENDYDSSAIEFFRSKFKCQQIVIQYYIKDEGKTINTTFDFLSSPDTLITKVFEISPEFPGMPQLFLPDSTMLDLTKSYRYLGCLNELYNNIILTVVVS